jgi:hypothetical protein
MIRTNGRRKLNKKLRYEILGVRVESVVVSLIHNS